MILQFALLFLLEQGEAGVANGPRKDLVCLLQHLTEKSSEKNKRLDLNRNKML